MASGLRYSIVRPTAFFKSLSGQIDRVRNGRPFLIFGDGTLTSCKPISDGDLGDFLVSCLEDARLWNCILPIGGPGEAITPRQQGEALFELLERQPKFQSVPVALLDGIIGGLSTLGLVAPSLREKAELARIGRYYATESMLVLDPQRGLYDAEATPSTGTETLFDFYRSVVAGATCLTEATMPALKRDLERYLQMRESVTCASALPARAAACWRRSRASPSSSAGKNSASSGRAVRTRACPAGR